MTTKRRLSKAAASKKASDAKRRIENYTHRKNKRVNNPPVGLVTSDTDRDAGKKTYAYDPHLDPALQWAGKAERASFAVPTVSLHVHERIDPRSVIEAVRRKNGENFVQGSLFSQLEENPPLREAVDFYKHKHNWSNRLIAGDSLLIMNSLLEKEGMAGKVQMVYIDPPYGIRYGSNFQPFVGKREVKEGKDEDLTQEPETIKAFRDTWELGIHSYLSYLRDRVLLVRELLHESGSCFVQISDENLHLVRNLLDEVFGAKNFMVLICYRRLGMMVGETVQSSAHYLIWYAKSKENVKSRKLFQPQVAGHGAGDHYNQVEHRPTGQIRALTAEERANPDSISSDWRPFQLISLATGGFRPNTTIDYAFEGKTYHPGPNKCWRTTKEGLDRLVSLGRVKSTGRTLRYRQYLDDFPLTEVTTIWDDTARDPENIYVVQTPSNVVRRCLLMTTDPGDLVFDPTCGSGTTAYVAEQWGRRWMTCDTSRVALTLAKQRLMASVFEYYQLAHPEEGVDSGFIYKTIPHITLKSVANNEPPAQEVLYDQPYNEKQRVRVTGPFTVEAVPAPVVKPLAEPETASQDAADISVARSGETQRQGVWRDELLKTGIRGKGGQRITFSRVEPLPGTRWLHADAETKEDKPQRVVVSFGPEHAPLEQRQVELALGEAETLRPRPKIVVFAAFQFDPEAAKDVDETNWPGVTLLKAQMNADLVTEDLKKKRASNESFWLIGQPDVELERLSGGEHKGKYQVTVNGFDYYNTKTGTIESGGADKIAMWMLDPDYDGRNLFPRQIFFPMAGEGEGWAKLARSLRAEIDEGAIEAYRGTVSLPFEAGKHKQAALKIVDDRGIESLKLIDLA